MYSVVKVSTNHLRRALKTQPDVLALALALARCVFRLCARVWVIAAQAGDCKCKKVLLIERDIENINQKVCVIICEWPCESHKYACYTT